MEIKISEALKELVENEFGSYNFELNLSTSIENDLGITGEDGVEFIKKYSTEFDINISEFVFSDYFHSEPSLLVNYGEVKSLTLGDLEIAKAKGFLK